MTTTTDARPDRRYVLIGLAVAMAAVAAIVGAYLDWMWWPVYSGIVITIAAVLILVIGGVVAVFTHGLARIAAVLAIVAGIGLLLGQNLGPSREELIGTEGTMTLTLTSPVAATGTSSAWCDVVASETEYSISGDPNMRLDTPDVPFVSVYLTKGDRWIAHRGSERPIHDDIMFSIDVTAQEVAADGGPSTISMAADADSTMDATFTNAGGSITFADLEARTGVDFTGESMDLAGTLTWTCDTP